MGTRLGNRAVLPAPERLPVTSLEVRTSAGLWGLGSVDPWEPYPPSQGLTTHWAVQVFTWVKNILFPNKIDYMAGEIGPSQREATSLCSATQNF